MAKKSVRLPGRSDLDHLGRARILVTDRRGQQRVRLAAAVDAREIILRGSGTLDVPGDLLEEEKRSEQREQELGGYSLKQLREFCKLAKISSTGKPESELRRLLVAAGFTPPNEENEDVVEIETAGEDDES